MYEVRVYGRNRDIPWVKDKQQTHIHLIAGSPVQTDDEEMVDHLRKFHLPEEGRGIEIINIKKKKSVRSMSLQELRAEYEAIGGHYVESDSRMDIMKKLRGVNNG